MSERPFISYIELLRFLFPNSFISNELSEEEVDVKFIEVYAADQERATRKKAIQPFEPVIRRINPRITSEIRIDSNLSSTASYKGAVKRLEEERKKRTTQRSNKGV